MKEIKRNIGKLFLIVLLIISLSSCYGIIPTIYTITSTAGAGGSISPLGVVTVNEGTNLTFTIIPTTGYKISDVLVDDTSVGAVLTYTFPNIQQNHTIQASFIQQTTPPSPTPLPPIYYTITSSAGIGGSIDPEGIVKVTKGNDRTFTITAGSCYQIADVRIDGVSIGAVSIYTFIDVQQNHTISASFLLSGSGVHNVDTGLAYATIQEAIVAATDGETIVVCPGNYKENIVFDGRNIAVCSINPQESTIVAATIINGQSLNSVVQFLNGDASTLQGFTIRNGNVTSSGGGIYVDNSSPTILDNTITKNTSSHAGGGIYVQGSSATIQHNIISDNGVKNYGGGIYVGDNSSPTICNNTISDNRVSDLVVGGGGGIAVFESSPIITQNIITGNTAVGGGGIGSFTNGYSIISDNIITVNTAYDGGGICVNSSNPTINNNVISGNVATVNGGGIYVFSSTPTVSGNTITSNTAANLGGGIHVREASNLLPETIGRPDGWGTGRENIPIGDPLMPAEGEEYTIAGNEFLGNEHGDPLGYSEGAHVYFVK